MPRKSGFTHFGSLPFIRPDLKQQLKLVQGQIQAVMAYAGFGNCISASSPHKFHMTLTMLKLTQENSLKASTILNKHMQEFEKITYNTVLTTGKIHYFTERDGENKQGPNYIRVIYLEVKEDQQFRKILIATDLMLKLLLQNQVITAKSLNMMGIHYDPHTKMYVNKNPHITLFKCRNLHEDQNFIQIFKTHLQKQFEGKQLPCNSIDVSYRFKKDADRFFHPIWRCSLIQKLL